jgi:hypothetical protein
MDVVEIISRLTGSKDKSELIEKLKKLIEKLQEAEEYREKYEELKKKLQQLLDELTQIQQGKPLSLAIAVLLAELLEYGSDYLPPIISDWVKAYVEAFRTAIDNLIGILKGRYFKLRQDGFPPDEASALVTSDPEVDAWLKVLWDIEHLAPPAPPSAGTGGSGAGASSGGSSGALPPAPHGPPWAPAFASCCTGLVIDQLRPKIELVSGSIFKDAGSWYAKATVSITQKCGIAEWDYQIFVVTSATQAIQLQSGSVTKPTETPQNNGVTATWDKIQVGHNEPRELVIRISAESNCGYGDIKDLTIAAP